MSFLSWKKEFYPIPVEDLPTNATDEELILHSLKKWEGALPKNLEKHSITVSGCWIFDAERECMLFDADSCALCDRYLSQTCSNCPLAKVATRCTVPFSSYSAFDLTNDPTQMIRDLKKALDYVRAIPKKETV